MSKKNGVGTMGTNHQEQIVCAGCGRTIPTGLRYCPTCDPGSIENHQIKAPAKSRYVNKSSIDQAKAIREFKSLLDDGIITKYEFDQKKNQILSESETINEDSGFEEDQHYNLSGNTETLAVDYQEGPEDNSLAKKTQMRVFWTFIMILVLFAMISSCAVRTIGPSSRDKSSVLSCQVCGKTYQAGDSGGNYMSIARTNLCKNCYENLKTAMDMYEEATGKPYTGG